MIVCPRGGVPTPGTIGPRKTRHYRGGVEEQKRRRLVRPAAGAGRGGLFRYAVTAFAVFLLKGLDVEAHFLGEAAGDKAAHAVGLMPTSA